MRIGFTSYVGDRSTGTCSLNTASVPIDYNNAAAIKTRYDALGPVLPFGTKSELPADAAIASVEPALEADPGHGDKYLLFATSGSTDFCDDGIQICPADTVTSRLQTLVANGIHTVVIGLPSATIGTWAVQNFANAGAGQAVAVPPSITGPADIYYQCMATAPWMAQWTSRGRTGTSPDATYATTGGSAPVYAAGSAAWPDLAAAVEAAFASMRSCSFSLDKFQIAPAKVTEGSVKIDGMTVAFDGANGWNMPTPTTVQLNGLACASWQTRTAQEIAFAFPCDAVQTN